LVPDPDGIVDPYLTAQAVCQQQLVMVRRYGGCCPFLEDQFLCEWSAVQDPYPIEFRWRFPESHPARAVVAMQFDDGDGKAPGGGNEGMPCFVYGRPVPFRIRKAHAGSVAIAGSPLSSDA
jgi:hypothetical protein